MICQINLFRTEATIAPNTKLFKSGRKNPSCVFAFFVSEVNQLIRYLVYFACMIPVPQFKNNLNDINCKSHRLNQSGSFSRISIS